jgi:hypothetical protein
LIFLSAIVMSPQGSASGGTPRLKLVFFEKRPGQALPLELEGFEPKQFSWEEKIQRELNGEAFPTVPAQKSITLRPHKLAQPFPDNNAIESRKIVYICK